MVILKHLTVQKSGRADKFYGCALLMGKTELFRYGEMFVGFRPTLKATLSLKTISWMGALNSMSEEIECQRCNWIGKEEQLEAPWSDFGPGCPECWNNDFLDVEEE